MDKKIYRCPVKGVVHAGMLSFWDDEDGNNTDVHNDYVDHVTSVSGEYYALKVHGECMAPRIYDGDIVIVREQSSVENGQIAVVVFDDDIEIKKMIRGDKGVILAPLNSSYAPRYFEAVSEAAEKIRIIGRVVGFKAEKNFV